MIQVHLLTANSRPQVRLEHDGGATRGATFPLLACRVCVECGNPVVVYAKGQFPFYDSKGKTELQPHKDGWRLAENADGFVLAVTEGHKFGHDGTPQCFTRETRETVAGVFTDAVLG